MTDRQLIIVDLETTGLDPLTCHILEVSAINADTGEELTFAPHVSNTALGTADKRALQINKYYERGIWEEMLTLEETTRSFTTLEAMLRGNTLGGSNPRYDAQVLSRCIDEVWHHRLADLSAYAAGKLNLAPTELPGLAQVCERLGVKNHEEHSAYYDAQATLECFKALQ
jgi:DNA polymerase-3 subunit epsilon